MTDRLEEIKANHDGTMRVHKALESELPSHREELSWLIAEVERLRAENWPSLSNESREKLYHACKSAGVNPDGKWLSECAVEAIDLLRVEVERLLSGKFTKEEIHNFCHDLPQTVPVCEFAAGCAGKQREFYGVAPDAEDAARWRYVREHPNVLDARNTLGYVHGKWYGVSADVVVDAARNAT